MTNKQDRIDLAAKASELLPNAAHAADVIELAEWIKDGTRRFVGVLDESHPVLNKMQWLDSEDPEPAPAPAPSWSPVVGGWAEHREHGRVLVLDFIDEDRIPQYRIYRRGGCIVEWVAPTSLSAPVPRVWERAEDVPAHVVVTDRYGSPWPGTDLHSDLAPFTEILPEGGVW